MAEPDFDRMTHEEAVAWFNGAESLAPAIRSMVPATDPSGPPPEVPMMLASIRLPVGLVKQLDEVAAADGSRRSDVIREALARYVASRLAPVASDEAEHALDVLRRVVALRTGTADAA
jgi:Arc/MetJ-type ribon-helix-helix transcriptional regulator